MVKRYGRRKWFSWDSERKQRFRPVLMEKQGGLCFYCSTPMVLPESGQTQLSDNNATLEHINDDAKKRGRTLRCDLVLACFLCNNLRSKRKP